MKMKIDGNIIDKIINETINDLKKAKEVSIVVNKKSPTSTTIRATYTDEDFRREATFTVSVNQNEIICTDNDNEEGVITSIGYFKYWLSRKLTAFVIESKILKLLEDHFIPVDTVSVEISLIFDKAIAYTRLSDKIELSIHFLAREKLKITRVSINLHPHIDEKVERMLLSALGSFIISLAVS